MKNNYRSWLAFPHCEIGCNFLNWANHLVSSAQIYAVTLLKGIGFGLLNMYTHHSGEAPSIQCGIRE